MNPAAMAAMAVVSIRGSRLARKWRKCAHSTIDAKPSVVAKMNQWMRRSLFTIVYTPFLMEYTF